VGGGCILESILRTEVRKFAQPRRKPKPARLSKFWAMWDLR